MINGNLGGEPPSFLVELYRVKLIIRFEGGRSSYEEHSVEKQFGSMSHLINPKYTRKAEADK